MDEIEKKRLISQIILNFKNHNKKNRDEILSTINLRG